MVEIGAGGGSIARVDALQRITVGPDSAGVGARARLLRPRRRDADRDGCRRRPRQDRSRRALPAARSRSTPTRPRRRLSRDVGEPLGMSAENGARTPSHEIVCENMASAARVHAVERGAVDRPAHADRLRRRRAAACRPRRREDRHRARDRAAECRRRLGRRLPGGARSPMRWCAAATCGSTPSTPRSPMRPARGDGARGARLGRAAARPARRLRERRAAFMRYVGQGHEITVALPDRRARRAADAASFRAEFEREYARLFERHIPGAAIEIMSWSVLATTEPPRPPTRRCRGAAQAGRRRRPRRRPLASSMRRARRRRRRGAAVSSATRPGSAATPHRGPAP